MKVLFISYFFKPFPGVGAKRISYWAENCSKHGVDAHVLTAIEQVEKEEGITFIPPVQSKSLLSVFIKDQGLNWINPLKGYFNQLKAFPYDAVVISGGPFMHFSIGNYLKRRFGAKVVLDFRDPFSTNPSFEDGLLKRKIKAFFERRFIKGASALIAVNKYCADLIVSNKKELFIIDNGFNENEFTSDYEQTVNEKPIIVHAGTFIQGVRNPEIFLQTLDAYFNEQVHFYQYGKDSTYFEPYRTSTFFEYKGMQPYDLLVKELERADICMLVTEGKPFESTTKIFDYIGLNKKILIITSGDLETGNLHQLTKDYPNVIWTKNKHEDIRSAINKLMLMQVQKIDTYPYSRAHSLEKFVALLKAL